MHTSRCKTALPELPPNLAGGLPEVTVLLITYNHERYIAQAMESVFEQRYPGRVRIIVCDDCSTDQTPREIERLARRSPAPIKVVKRTANVGGLRNLAEAWTAATGAYVALLEGDDYWVNDQKLKLQVSAMEDRPSSSLSFGLAALLDERCSPPALRQATRPPSAKPDLNDVLVDGFIQTCTAVYRRGVLPVFPPWFANCLVRDWPLNAIHAARGEIVFIDSVLAVARVHGGGRWTAMPFDERLRGSLELRARLTHEFGLPYGWSQGQLNARTLVTMALMAQRKADALRALARALRASPAAIRDPRFLYASCRWLLGERASRSVRAAHDRSTGRRRDEPRDGAPGAASVRDQPVTVR